MKCTIKRIAKGVICCVFLSLCSCDRPGGDSLQRAWEQHMSSFAARDYGALWDSMSEDSQQDTIRVLTHLKRNTQYRESMQRKFKIPARSLKKMQPRDFFIALMNGTDRALPQIVKIRSERFKTARFVRAEIQEHHATVFWESTGGGAESMTFMLEDRQWKPVIKR
jgi:hypothetical protein